MWVHRWHVLVWISMSERERKRGTEIVIETRTSRFRGRGLCQALFPVVHSSGDLVTPVPSQPMS